MLAGGKGTVRQFKPQTQLRVIQHWGWDRHDSIDTEPLCKMRFEEHYFQILASGSEMQGSFDLVTTNFL